MPKPLTVWIPTNCGKFLQRWDTRPTDLPPENLYAGQEATVRTGHGTKNWFKIGKGVQALAEIKMEEISTTSYAQMTPELKSLLMKKESEKVDLKLTFQKLRSWHPVPSLHGKQMGKQWKQ